jgi:hypothetical protein
MNFQFYFEKLKDSDSFKKYLEENPDGFLCSGFFAFDKKANHNQQHVDYYSPSKKELVSFCVSESCQKNPTDIVDMERIFEPVPEDLDIEFDEIEKLIFDEMEKREIKKEVEKVLYSLQAKEGKAFIIATVFISTLGMISAKVNLEEMKIEEFEKKRFMDMINLFKRKEKKE